MLSSPPPPVGWGGAIPGDLSTEFRSFLERERYNLKQLQCDYRVTVTSEMEESVTKIQHMYTE